MPSSPSTLTTPQQAQLEDLIYKTYRTGQDGSVAQATTQVGDWGYAPITTATTTTVKTGAGQLGSIIVLGGTMGTIQAYDNTAASGSVIVPAFTPVTPGANGPNITPLNVAFSVGLTIVTGAATLITVTYR